MNITSFSFFVFFLFSLIVYYAAPSRFRWCVLLFTSVIFFLLSGSQWPGLFLLAGIATTFISAGQIEKYQTAGNKKRCRLALAAGIIINIGILAYLKYSDFTASNINLILSIFHISARVHIPVPQSPIGVSFYTLQAVGYLLDVYWGVTNRETNPFKTALFIGYYPQLISGPIARHEDMNKTLFTPHTLNLQQIVYGLERMLWGLFKKLVISTRVGIIVDTIYGDPETYAGFYIWLAALLFMLQLYTDFSGCMDIIIGASECYGVVLPENFRTPFFSQSVQEFWQRWHITLGSWLKDYILYPILRTKTWKKMTKWIKERYGKKAAKQIPAYLAMLCVWLLIGLWHGGKWKYVLGQGLWFFTCIVLSQALDPTFTKMKQKLRINDRAFSYKMFRSLRVYCLVCFGNIFFRLDSIPAAFHAIKLGLSRWNPEIFFDESLYALGLDQKDFRLMIVSLFVLLLISVIQEKHGSIRRQLEKQNIVFRYFILLALLFSVVIFGVYGPGYDAAAFIYEAF